MPTLSRILMASLSLSLCACSDDGGTKVPDQGVPSCTAKTPLAADNAVGDFTQEAAPSMASTLTALTALIDGGSEKYTQGGKFVCMAWVKYKSTTKAHTLEVWLFDQTDVAGATAAYANTSNPDDTDLSPTIGEAARGHENTVSDIYQADMRKGKYLVRVIASKGTGKDDALAMLTAVAGKI